MSKSVKSIKSKITETDGDAKDEEKDYSDEENTHTRISKRRPRTTSHTSHEIVQKTPKQVAKEHADRIDHEDRIVRYPFIQFLGARLEERPDKYLKIRDDLDRLRRDINNRSVGTDFGSNSLYSMVSSFMNTNPSPATRERVKKLAMLMYPHMPGFIHDLFENIQMRDEFINNPSFDVDERSRTLINFMRHTRPDEWNPTLNPHFPHYFINRATRNMGPLVEMINKNEADKANVDAIQHDFANSSADTGLVEYAHDRFRHLEGMMAYTPFEEFFLSGRHKDDGSHNFKSKEYYDDLTKRRKNNVRMITEKYSPYITTGDQDGWNNVANTLVESPNLLYFKHPDTISNITRYLRDRTNSFIDDYDRSMHNLGNLIKYDYGEVDNMLPPIPYNFEVWNIHRPSIEPEIEDRLRNNPLNAVRQNMNTNLGTPTFLLDWGDNNFVDSDRLLRYLTHRDVEEIARDDPQVIENYVYKGGGEQAIIDYFHQDVPFRVSQELMSAYNENRLEDIPLEYYPMIYGHHQLFNDPKFQELKSRLGDVIEHKTREYTKGVESFLEDKTNTIRKLQYINTLMGKTHNVNSLPLAEALSVYESGEEAEAKKVVSMLEGKDLNEEEREQLATALEDLKRIRDTRKHLKAIIQAARQDDNTRAQIYESNNKMLNEYQRSLDMLRHVADGHNENDYIDWNNWKRYYIDELNKTQDPDMVNNLLNQSKIFLRLSKLAGVDTDAMEDWVNTLAEYKKNNNDYAQDPNFVSQQMESIINEINDIHDLNLNNKSNMDSLIDSINSLRPEIIEGVSRTLSNIQDARFDEQAQRIHDVYRNQLAARRELQDEMSAKYNLDKQRFDELKNEVARSREATMNRLDEMTKELQNTALNENDRADLTRQIEQLQLTIQSITDDESAAAEIRKIIGASEENLNNKFQKIANDNFNNYSNLQQEINKLKNGLNVKVDHSEVSAAADSLLRSSAAMEEIVNRHLHGMGDLRDEIYTAGADTKHAIHVLYDSLSDQLNDVGNVLREDIDRMRRYNNDERFRELQENIGNISDRINQNMREHENTIAELFGTNFDLNEGRLQDIKRQTRDHIDKKTEELNSTWQAALNNIHDKEEQQKELANELKGNLREVYEAVRMNKEPISKEERYKTRFNEIFSNEDKVKQALLSNVIRLSEDEDLKQKYFREKISQPKLKEALGFLPSDPDLTLDQVEKYLPSGFFADVQANIADKNIAPIRIKTTNYEAANATSDSISEGLKQQLVRLYYYYKDPKHRTEKKNEYPREFLNDLAMLNTNGKPSDIKKRYIHYLKTGQII